MVSGSPTDKCSYVVIITFVCSWSWSPYPALLLTQVNSFTLLFRSPPIRCSGIPQSPKPWYENTGSVYRTHVGATRSRKAMSPSSPFAHRGIHGFQGWGHNDIIHSSEDVKEMVTLSSELRDPGIQVADLDITPQDHPWGSVLSWSSEEGKHCCTVWGKLRFFCCPSNIDHEQHATAAWRLPHSDSEWISFTSN